MPSSRAYVLALAVAVAASATSLRNGFVYDDVAVIQHDARVHSLAEPLALLRAPYWPSEYQSNAYRPATTAAFALEWAAGGGRPLAFHATNVALNLLVVALVLVLASRALGGGGALVAALWFAVQPVHVEAVANGVGVGELLAAAAYLAALLAYLADGDAAAAGARATLRRGLLSLVVLVTSAIAFGAKESAITLPAALALGDAWEARRAGMGWAARFRSHAVLWCGVTALAIGYLAARGAVLGGAFLGGAVAPGLAGVSAAGRAVVMAPAVLAWLQWFILPIHLSADYLPDAFVPSTQLDLAHVAGFVVLAAAAWAAWATRKRAPAVMAGLVFAALTASVAANVVVPTGVLLAERLAYLPSVGMALVAGGVWERLPRGRWLWPATAIVLALFAARTLARIPAWRDPASMLAALVRDAPHSYRTHWALGAEAFKHGQFGTGEREMLAAIRINPLDATPARELGEKYLAAGVFVPAARFLAASYRFDTLSTDAAARAEFAYLKAGQPDSAAALGAEALRRAPGDAGLLAVTENAYLAAGQPRQALALARRLVYLDPRSWIYRQMAAYAAAASGRCDEARARLEQAVSAAPGEREPRQHLSEWRDRPGCGLGGGGRPRPGAAR